AGDALQAADHPQLVALQVKDLARPRHHLDRLHVGVEVPILVAAQARAVFRHPAPTVPKGALVGRRRKASPAGASASSTGAQPAPGSTVTVCPMGSTSSTRFMREKLTATPPRTGRAPPHGLVAPPRGTRENPSWAARWTSSTTSSVRSGQTTAEGRVCRRVAHPLGMPAACPCRTNSSCWNWARSAKRARNWLCTW